MLARAYILFRLLPKLLVMEDKKKKKVETIAWPMQIQSKQEKKKANVIEYSYTAWHEYVASIVYFIRSLMQVREGKKELRSSK